MSSLTLVGLTGSIGSGKSTVLELFQELGVPTLSSDAIVHRLYDDPAIKDSVVAHFGDQVIENGKVNRASIAKIVFNSPDELTWLEGLLWPRVRKEIAEWPERVAAKERTATLAVIEVPLLFESGLEQAFSHTVTVSAKRSARVARVAGRMAELEAREQKQLSDEEKAMRADSVIVNNGSVSSLRAEVVMLIERLNSLRD